MDNTNTTSPKGYLLLHNVQKRNNIGIIIRSASAFNLSKIFLISKHEDEDKSVKLKKVKKEF